MHKFEVIAFLRIYYYFRNQQRLRLKKKRSTHVTRVEHKYFQNFFEYTYIFFIITIFHFKLLFLVIQQSFI